MDSENLFRAPEEELARLNSELAEIRAAIRDISSRLIQIERHVKRAFGVKEEPGKKLSPKQNISHASAMSPDDALTLFNHLTEISREKGNDGVEERLRGLNIADLKFLAHELGVSFTSKPSRQVLHKGIRGRVSESVMLSQNRNVTVAASERSNGSPDIEK